VSTSVLNGLGQALRWLRERHGKKQYQVADDAGITKGMLSAYETGRQRPSLETLEKVLGTLSCDLHDLHNSLQIVNGRPQILRQRGMEAAESGGERPDVYRVLGLKSALPAQEERAIAQILDGFHSLLRYMHRKTKDGAAPQEPPASGEAEDGNSEPEDEE
jgi:transcriptional regulator with XRE-family HTH domain